MRTYAYRLDHDLGFAPNPFFGACTLACCMQEIRRRACHGDLVVGMAGSGRQGLKRIHPQMIYWMKVSEAIPFNTYWSDPRFAEKRPRIEGPIIQKVGDNTYRRSPDSSEWSFETSMHFIPGSAQKNGGHVVKDTSVDRVLIAEDFTYWGASGPVVPPHLIQIFPARRGYKVNHDEDRLAEFLEFLDLDSPAGLAGEPADWDNSKYFQSGSSK